MDAWRIYSAAARHKYVIVLAVVVAVTAAVVASLLMPRFYVASATLLPTERAIRGTSQRTSSVPETPYEVAPRETRVADLVILARSRAVAEGVAFRTGLTERALMEQVDVSTVSRPGGVPTDIIRVSARLKDPAAAVRVANAWAVQFVRFYDEVSHREAIEARKFLEDVMYKARRQVDAAEQEFAALRRQHGVTDLPVEVGAALTELGPLRTERDELQAKLADIRARLATRRAQVRSLSLTKKVTAQEVPTATIEALKKSIADAKAELIKLTQTYTDEYYRVKELRQQIAASQAELDRQTRRLDTVVRVVDDPSYQKVIADISDLEAESRAGQARLSRLNVLVEQREAKIGSYSNVDLLFDQKRRAYTQAQERYASLVDQVHAARINERISNETGAIRLIDVARSAEGPMHVGPSLAQLVGGAALVGLLLGLGVALAVETLDTRVRTTTDAEQLMELPVTGVIPTIPSLGDGVQLPALVTQNAPMSPYAESYRFLATEVLLDAPSRNIRSIMIATAKPGQGGTSTICNLAVTLAQAGRRVVLVDADLRRPSLHTVFGTENDFGLANVLSNGASASEALKPTLVDNLLLLTGGANIDNPWALLRSAKMPMVVEELKRIADYVLIDTPSAIVFADAATLASVVDGVLVVVRANESPRGTELQIKGLLNRANANIMGVVLNDAPPASVDNYHFYTHYYARLSLPEAPQSLGSGRDEEEFAWSRGDFKDEGDSSHARD